MNFAHEIQYGQDRFFPIDIKAKRFVEAFPGSSGKRKSLTLEQLTVLSELEVPFLIKEKNLILLEPIKE